MNMNSLNKELFNILEPSPASTAFRSSSSSPTALLVSHNEQSLSAGALGPSVAWRTILIDFHATSSENVQLLIVFVPTPALRTQPTPFPSRQKERLDDSK
jgi:hypothetical protein